MRYGLRYDLRNPKRWHKPWDNVYRHLLEQVEWADQAGFDMVTLNEHHFAPDGYLPSPFVVAGAIAARTKRVKIALSLVLLPLKHPVQVAEDAAVLDIISGGRLELTVGAGYRQEEFAGYGISISERPSRMEEATEIIRRCWEEESFDFTGRHWNLRSVSVMPKPIQQPRPRIQMGGSSSAAARRAARLSDGFLGPAQFQADWREEMISLGKDPGSATMASTEGFPSLFVHVAEDPEAAWKRIGEHALYESNSYASWNVSGSSSTYAFASDPSELVNAGTHGVITPDQAIDIGRHLRSEGIPSPRLTLQPMMGGMPLELGQNCLELVVSKVMPALDPFG
jgi:alkanesulfonate monooxygenase SsuD/methylene tetrahydromethanopterin reductase-like flavin-dependent oxidoreductase (luciferase family)